MNSMILSAYAWAQSLRSTVIESLKQESGQDLVEYAVLVGAIGIVAAVALFAFDPLGTALDDFKTAVAGCIRFDATDCGTP